MNKVEIEAILKGWNIDINEGVAQYHSKEQIVHIYALDTKLNKLFHTNITNSNLALLSADIDRMLPANVNTQAVLAGAVGDLGAKYFHQQMLELRNDFGSYIAAYSKHTKCYQLQLQDKPKDSLSFFVILYFDRPNLSLVRPFVTTDAHLLSVEDVKNRFIDALREDRKNHPKRFTNVANELKRKLL